MKKRKPQPRKKKSEPSIVDQFKAAMADEESRESVEHNRDLIVEAFLRKIASVFPSTDGPVDVVGIDISQDTILGEHECVRCAASTKCIGFIPLGPDLVCVYPICHKCGKMASVEGPVSEEIERIVYETLGLEQ